MEKTEQIINKLENLIDELKKELSIKSETSSQKEKSSEKQPKNKKDDDEKETEKDEINEMSRSAMLNYSKVYAQAQKNGKLKSGEWKPETGSTDNNDKKKSDDNPDKEKKSKVKESFGNLIDYDSFCSIRKEF